MGNLQKICELSRLSNFSFGHCFSSCLFIKVLGTRGYLVSFLRHFCPTRVNTKESLYHWGWIPKPMMDIYTQRGSGHRWDRWSAFRYKRFTKAGFGLHTREEG